MVGNCSTLAFNVLISASVSLAKSDIYLLENCLH